MIPTLTGPLVKDIRTGEGILEDALIVANGVLAATSNLSWQHAAVYSGILAVVKGTRRGLVKAVALQSGLGIGAPVQPTGTFGGQSLSTVLDELDSTVTAAAPAGQQQAAAPATPAS